VAYRSQGWREITIAQTLDRAPEEISRPLEWTDSRRRFSNVGCPTGAKIMKPSQIEIGKTYKNRGAGKTKRTVVDLGTHIKPPWMSDSLEPNEPGVKYLQGNNERMLFLCSFAKWAGGIA
jgi:hypothetical protein